MIAFNYMFDSGYQTLELQNLVKYFAQTGNWTAFSQFSNIKLLQSLPNGLKWNHFSNYDPWNL